MAKDRADLREWYDKTKTRSGIYYENFTFPGQPRSQKTLKTADRDTAAERVRDKWKEFEHAARQASLVRQGLIPPPPKNRRVEMTLQQAVDKYEQEHGYKLPSRVGNVGHEKVIIAELGGDTLLSEIDTAMVARLILALERETVRYRDGDRPMSESTINHHATHLRAIMRRARLRWNALCDPDAIAWGGADGVLLPLPDYRPKTIRTDEDEDVLLAALDPDTRKFFLTSLAIGARAANIYNLKKPRVEWEDKVARSGGVIVVQVKSRKRSRLKDGESTKTKRYPITAYVADLLREAMDETDDPEGHVFTYLCRRNRHWTDKTTGERCVQDKGQRYPFTKSLLRQRWLEAKERAGVSDLRWHGLRATFATRLREMGFDLVDIKEAMGHSDISTTMRYFDIPEEATRKVLERADQERADRRAQARRKALNVVEGGR